MRTSVVQWTLCQILLMAFFNGFKVQAQKNCYIASVCDGIPEIMSTTLKDWVSRSCENCAPSCNLENIQSDYLRVLAQYESLEKSVGQTTTTTTTTKGTISTTKESPATRATTTKAAAITTKESATTKATVTEASITSTAVSTDNCTIKGTGGCFYVRYQEYRTANMSAGQTLCTDDGYVLAVIQDIDTLNKVEKAARLTDSKSFYKMALWTGVSYDPKNNIKTPSNAYVEWQAEYPKPGSGRTQILVRFSKNGTSESRGMENVQPSVKLRGSVCQLKS